MAAPVPAQQERTPHGAKAAEVYGIVGYLLSLMTFGARPACRAPSGPRLRVEGRRVRPR